MTSGTQSHRLPPTKVGEGLVTYESVELGETIHMESQDTLNAEHLRTMARKSESLKNQLNTQRFELQKRQLQQQRLNEQYQALIKANADYEERYSNQRLLSLEAVCSRVTEDIALAEIDTGMYTHLRSREQAHRQDVGNAIESVKAQLRKVGDLGHESAQINACMEATHPEGKDALTQQGIDESRDKLHKGLQTYQALSRQIEESTGRIEKQREEQLLFRRKQERLRKTTWRLKEREEYYQTLIKKLRLCKDEYNHQYARLLTTLGVGSTEEIAAKKERKEIETQSDANTNQELIERIRCASLQHWILEQQLLQLRNATSAQQRAIDRERVFDKGEYNPDVPASQYVENTERLERYKWRIDEKVDLIRKVVSGVKHVLFKLHYYDKTGETGTWYDLNAIASIDDMATEIRPKCSQLLLFLEQKITSFYTLIMQQVKHIHRLSLDDFGSTTEQLLPNCILERGLVSCCEVLQEVAAKTLSSESLTAAFSRRTSIISLSSSRPIAGVAIPRLVELRAKPHDQPSDPSRQDSELLRLAFGASGEKPVRQRTQDHTLAFLNDLDMLQLNAKIFEECRRGRTAALALFSERTAQQRKHNARQENEQEQEQEQAQITQTFSLNRVKQKRNIRHKEQHFVTDEGKLIAPKKKKRVTKLTEQIEREMAQRPPQLIAAATETFETLDKAKRTRSIFALARTPQEKEYLYRATPNFVSAVLNMKRARKGERIEKIAPKCRYFLVSPEAAATSLSARTLPSASLSRRSKASAQPDTRSVDILEPGLIQSYEKRIDHLKSLTQIDKLPRSSSTAFEDFYFATNSKVRTSQLSPQQHFPSPTSRFHTASQSTVSQLHGTSTKSQTQRPTLTERSSSGTTRLATARPNASTIAHSPYGLPVVKKLQSPSSFSNSQLRSSRQEMIKTSRLPLAGHISHFSLNMGTKKDSAHTQRSVI